MARSLLVAAVALLAVTAGCAGFGGQSTTTSESTGTTAAPATTTTEPTQSQPVIAAPGFNSGRLVDPLALADAHAGWLAGTSFEKSDERTTRSDGNTTHWATTLRVENESRWLAAQTFDGVAVLDSTSGSVTQYADGDTVYFRIERTDGNVSYGHRVDVGGEESSPDSPRVFESRHARDYVYAVFTTASWTTIVDQTSGDGQTVYRVLGNASGDTQFRGDPVSNFTVDASVTGDGFVQRMAVAYDQNGTAVSRTVEFSGVGETTVEQPEWFDTAVNQTDADSSGE